MMEREEAFLGELKRRAPSVGLDARVEQLLAAQSYRPAAGLRVPLWQCVLACAACALAAFLGARYAGAPPALPQQAVAPAVTEVRYVVQVEGEAFDVFDWTKYPKKNAPDSRIGALGNAI